MIIITQSCAFGKKPDIGAIMNRYGKSITMENNQRQAERSYLSDLLEVMDDSTHQIIGHLQNISLIGLLIISNEPIELNEKLSLRISIPDEGLPDIQGPVFFTFNATCKWNREGFMKGLVENGFEINYIPDDSQEKIDFLINCFGVVPEF
ncbi:MAG: PilZ domain-containing protein [Deltaproteobacteria bacterium]|nr:PilZ domain-containing protein [Deltaproteobacteria bacterium]